MWLSSFFEKPLVSRVKRRIPIRNRQMLALHVAGADLRGVRFAPVYPDARPGADRRAIAGLCGAWASRVLLDELCEVDVALEPQPNGIWVGAVSVGRELDTATRPRAGAGLTQATIHELEASAAPVLVRLWADCVELVVEHRLPERTASGLYDAAHGVRLRNAFYRKLVQETLDEQISELTASRDLKALVDARLLNPVPERHRPPSGDRRTSRGKLKLVEPATAHASSADATALGAGGGRRDGARGRLHSDFFERGENFVHGAVAVVLMIVAFVMLGQGVMSFLTGPSSATDLVSGVLFAVIIVEIMRTVLAHFNGIGLQLRPFLTIGIISAVREILTVGARLSLSPPEKLVHSLLQELGFNTLVVVGLAVSLVLLSRLGGTDGAESGSSI